jgi:phage shock protein PspC (stress-responsive transcriptional regulator)
MAKKLYRSATNRMIWGVCGGLAEYFDVDPVLVRVIFVVLALASGVGLLLYIALAIVIPPGRVLTPISPEGLQPEEAERSTEEPGHGPLVAGAILVAVGLILLLSNLGLTWWLDWGTLWPLVLIAIGAAIFLGRWRR